MEERCQSFRIDAELLIPGRGEPISKGSVVIKGKKIAFVGATRTLPAEYVKLATTEVPVVMPGMWDCHVHYFGSDAYSFETFASTPPALAGARIAKDLATTLEAGFTSVRELTGWGWQVAKAVEENWISGPNVYSAVSLISQTGGHGDAHGLPIDMLERRMHHGESPLTLCDGVDECLKAVRMQVRRGAHLIKLAASGGISSLIDEPKAQQFSNSELTAMVEEAARCDRIVAAHCHGKRGIMAALRAGCHTIEHGSYLDQESIDLMLREKVMLVATRSIFEFGVQHPEAWSEDVYAKLITTSESHKKAYQLAVKQGVHTALGTDLGVSSNDTKFNHGMNGLEFEYAITAGMTHLEAIEAGTANGPDTLGPQAPMSGQIKEDYDADLIALSENPLDNIKVLGIPEKVTHVWKGGRLFKCP